jgi:hypothetical protein
MKQINTNMVYELLEESNLSKEAREFFEYFLKHPVELEKTNKLIEDNEFIAEVGMLMADFMEELGKEEGLKILKSICKARPEEEFQEVFRDIQEKMELHASECKGEA